MINSLETELVNNDLVKKVVDKLKKEICFRWIFNPLKGEDQNWKKQKINF